jgi:DNA-binding transcriptional regulator YiaG
LKELISISIEEFSMKNAKKLLEKHIGPPKIGMLIRSYRTANDLTIQELAFTLGVTKGYISNVETGKRYFLR